MVQLFDAPVPCLRCGGVGTVRRDSALCARCKGEGITTEKRPIPVQDCTTCFGKGYAIETRELSGDRFEHRTDPCGECTEKRQGNGGK
jgi:DnaJ-class molecular chaperone